MQELGLTCGALVLVAMPSIVAQQLLLDRPPWSWFDRTWVSESAPMDVIGDSALVDLDADGDLDLVLLRSHHVTWTGSKSKPGPDIAAYSNDGSGAFTRTELRPLTTELLEVGGFDWADFDGDGDADAVLWDGNIGQDVRVYRNDGDGQMEPIERPQLAAAQGRSGACSWVEQRDRVCLACGVGGVIQLIDVVDLSTAAFPGTYRQASGARIGLRSRVDWTDFDGDGDLDVVSSDAGIGGGFSVLMHDPQDTLRPLPIAAGSGECRTDIEVGEARWADLDQDGIQDLVVAACGIVKPGSPDLIFRGAADGSLACVPGALSLDTPTSRHSRCVVADFDADGDPDVFFVGYINARSSVAENLGGMKFRVHPFGRDGEPVPDAGGLTVAVGDINADARPDLVFAGLGDNRMILLGRPPKAGQAAGW